MIGPENAVLGLAVTGCVAVAGPELAQNDTELPAFLSSKCLNDTCRALLVKLTAAISLSSAIVALLLPVSSFPSLAPGSVGTIVMFQSINGRLLGNLLNLAAGL